MKNKIREDRKGAVKKLTDKDSDIAIMFINKCTKKTEEKTTVVQILGGLMIGFAVIDFAASFAGYNLTPFLGSASRFSPIVFGLIGSALLNSNSK